MGHHRPTAAADRHPSGLEASAQTPDTRVSAAASRAGRHAAEKACIYRVLVDLDMSGRVCICECELLQPHF